MHRSRYRQLTLSVVWLALLEAGCKPPEQPAVISIVGAVLLDGTGGPPISDSVITIENGRIRAAGARVGLLVPVEAEKVDGAGKFVVPAPIDVLHRGAANGAPGYTVVRPSDPDSALDPARRDRTPLFGDVFSLRDARTLVDRGATGLLHMIRDTEAIDPAFIARLRDLRIVFVPMLAEERNPVELGIAKRNTKRMADGGVLIAVGSAGERGDTRRERDLLVEAGLSPADVLAAATRNGAAALRDLDQAGTIEPGKRADLLLLSANPAEEIHNLRKIDRAMRNGQWVEPF
ncbi:MAG: amidohydrolase family protein [Bryobacteraceae bacterium]|jgi:imidazolonepropionase-like amidohydrolase